MPSPNRNGKNTREIVVSKLQDSMLRVTKEVVLLGDCFVASDPVFLQSPELKCIITLPSNILKHMLGWFLNAQFVTNDFTAFTYCENISGRNMEQRGSGAQNVDVTQLMGAVDDNSLKEGLETCKHFWRTLIWRMRDRDYNFALDTLDPNYLLVVGM